MVSYEEGCGSDNGELWTEQPMHEMEMGNDSGCSLGLGKETGFHVICEGLSCFPSGSRFWEVRRYKHRLSADSDHIQVHSGSPVRVQAKKNWTGGPILTETEPGLNGAWTKLAPGSSGAKIEPGRIQAKIQLNSLSQFVKSIHNYRFLDFMSSATIKRELVSILINFN